MHMRISNTHMCPCVRTFQNRFSCTRLSRLHSHIPSLQIQLAISKI